MHQHTTQQALRETVILGQNNGVLQKTYNRVQTLNALDSKGNYSATSNNMKLVHWPLIGGLLH